jgi:hypothetical protein
MNIGRARFSKMDDPPASPLMPAMALDSLGSAIGKVAVTGSESNPAFHRGPPRVPTTAIRWRIERECVLLNPR